METAERWSVPRGSVQGMGERKAGAWPLCGEGPREGVRGTVTWPLRRADADGPSPTEIRRGGVRRTSYGLYVPSGVDRTLEQSIVEAAAVHRNGVVTGWAALAWMRARWFGEGDPGPVPIAVGIGHGGGTQPHLVVTDQEFLSPREVMRVDGLRITIPVRSVTYEMRRAPTLTRALQVADMGCYSDLVSRDEIARYCRSELPIQTGVGMVREALPHIRENAWSPAEVMMRRCWQEARPDAVLLCNVPIFSLQGIHLATPDVLDPLAGVFGEYESWLHLVGARRAADIAREERLRGAGLEGVTMVASDANDLTDFLTRLEGAHRRAVDRPGPRLWTLEKPAWWVDTSTVAARRALTDAQRRRLLRYRRAA